MARRQYPRPATRTRQRQNGGAGHRLRQRHVPRRARRLLLPTEQPADGGAPTHHDRGHVHPHGPQGRARYIERAKKGDAGGVERRGRAECQGTGREDGHVRHVHVARRTARIDQAQHHRRRGLQRPRKRPRDQDGYADQYHRQRLPTTRRIRAAHDAARTLHRPHGSRRPRHRGRHRHVLRIGRRRKHALAHRPRRSNRQVGVGIEDVGDWAPRRTNADAHLPDDASCA